MGAKDYLGCRRDPPQRRWPAVPSSRSGIEREAPSGVLDRCIDQHRRCCAARCAGRQDGRRIAVQHAGRPDIYFVHESEGSEHQPDRHPKPGEDATGQLRQPFKTGASTSEAAQTGSTGAITSLRRDALEGKIDGASQFSLPAVNVDRIEQVLGAAWDLRRRSADRAKPASAKRLRADTLLPKFDRGMSGSWSRPTRSWPTARTGTSFYSQSASLPQWLTARFSAAANIGGAAAANKKGRCWHDDRHCQHEGSG
ncbi:MAG TPA: hypothetical protein VFG73_07710 [Rhodanobacteraceae bacterium]|nr:hypothetical protein [Rhodanobacteraceae bacterium]